MCRPFHLIGWATAVLAAWLVGSCADVPIPNRPPTVTITADPIRDSANAYVVTFMWEALDDDGRVERFLYAVDDTMPGSWMETRDYELTLVATATSLAGVDSIRIGTVFLERYRFRDAHTFYLKAVDDDGAESAPVALSFTAETFAPETKILTPLPTVLVNLGPTFHVTWEGTDLDGTGAPLSYAFRVVTVDNAILLSDAMVESTLFDPESPGEPWSPFEERTSTVLDLAVPHDYVFGVVARDEAGAVEPRLRGNATRGPTNTLKIRARETGGIPRLRVWTSFKSVTFPTGDPLARVFQIPSDTDIEFNWMADASSYGGRITGYSYGFDLSDPGGNDPGWSPWSMATQLVTRWDGASGPVEHLFYVRAMDEVGGTVVGDMTLLVLPPLGDRDVLYVDDFPDPYGRVDPDCIPPPPGGGHPTADWPHDQCHDQFLREAIARGLAANGHPDWVVDRYEPHDPLTGEVRRGEVAIDSTSFDYWVYDGPVTLDHLLSYKAVVWNVRSEERTQLWEMNRPGSENLLAAYLEGGSAVWIMGTGTFSRMRSAPESVGLAPWGFESEDFLFRFLKIESVIEGGECTAGCFRVSGQTAILQRMNGFDGAYPHPAAAAEGYPELRVTREPFALPTKGIPNCEGMVIGLDINDRLRLFGGRLDTLYFYQSNQKLQIFPYDNSWMDDAACALRYSGPGQGRLAVFGFPLYFMPVSEVDPVMAVSLRWLLE